MSDAPPQLGDIKGTSGFSIPTLSSTSQQSGLTPANGSATTSNAQDTLSSAKNSVVNNTQSTMSSIANHPVTQNMKETVNNAPVADAVKDQQAKTSAELNNLANARKVPETRTATDQPLTHYHSFFYTLLSWENPRVTGITYASVIATILAFRYVPAASWLLKSLWISLGTIALVESGAKLAFGGSFAASLRPKKYATVPREFLEASLEDVEQLINFFVIEFQRVLFAENVSHTIAAFVASLTAYFLVKIMPFWGLTLTGASVVFLTPLVYVTNKEFIDEHLSNANEMVNAQSAQFRDLAGGHMATAGSTLKSYAGDYTTKAQEMVGGATGKRSPSSGSTVKAADFPTAPKQEPAVSEKLVPEPQLAA